MRLMSVALTEQAVVERRKTVTRRLGWTFLQPGDRLQLVRKSMGRRRADGTVEPLVRLAVVEVASVTRIPLTLMSKCDTRREGFPALSPDEFVVFFTKAMRCRPETIVTRIAWRYLTDIDLNPPSGFGLLKSGDKTGNGAVQRVLS